MWNKLTEFFSALLPHNWIQSILRTLIQSLGSGAAMEWAKRLFLFALFLTVLGTVMDIVLNLYGKDFSGIADRITSAFAAMRDRLFPRAAQNRARQEAMDRMMAVDQQVLRTDETLEKMEQDLAQAAQNRDTAPETHPYTEVHAEPAESADTEAPVIRVPSMRKIPAAKPNRLQSVTYGAETPDTEMTSGIEELPPINALPTEEADPEVPFEENSSVYTDETAFDTVDMQEEPAYNARPLSHMDPDSYLREEEDFADTDENEPIGSDQSDFSARRPSGSRPGGLA